MCQHNSLMIWLFFRSLGISMLSMSCCVVSCHVMSCYVMFCHVTLCHIILFYVMFCYVILCHVTSCHGMLRHVMLCYVMPCHIMSCHVILCGQAVYTASVPEDTPANTVVLRVGATDADVGVSAWIQYTLHGPDSKDFSIDLDTGKDMGMSV